MKSYSIHDIFVTLQGEGARAGERSVFARFSGCNLWSGLPEARSKGSGACAVWCDTSFAGGEKLTAEELLVRLSRFSGPAEPRWVVLSGGEPLLQVDQPLVDLLNLAGWRVAIETNGTQELPAPVPWVTVSPKKRSKQVLTHGNELKVVLQDERSQGDWTDDEVLQLGTGQYDYRFVQPLDPINPSGVEKSYLHGTEHDLSTQYEANLARCIRFVMEHPEWRLSLQTHKLCRLP